MGRSGSEGKSVRNSGNRMRIAAQLMEIVLETRDSLFARQSRHRKMLLSIPGIASTSSARKFSRAEALIFLQKETAQY
jgi:hypothetical protein